MNTMIRVLSLSVLIGASGMAIAGVTEDANAVVDMWSATYSANDTEKIAQLYTSDGILLRTVSPVVSVGTEAIPKYFTPLKGSGNKNTIQERHTIVLARCRRRSRNWLLRVCFNGRWKAYTTTLAFHDARDQARRAMAYRSSSFFATRVAQDITAPGRSNRTPVLRVFESFTAHHLP